MNVVQEWQRSFQEASVALTGRDVALAAVAERLEQDLQLLGATAVEDRLQEGVPQAIATLLRAGLKVQSRLYIVVGSCMAQVSGAFKCCCLLANQTGVSVQRTEFHTCSVMFTLLLFPKDGLLLCSAKITKQI